MLALLLFAQVSLPMIEENSVEDVKIEIPSPVQETPNLTVTINAGGLSSLSSVEAYTITPTATIQAYAKLAANKNAPKLDVSVSLASLPGESISLDDITTFKSVEFQAGLEQPIPNIYPKLYAGFGLATRLPGDTDPRVSAAKYFTAGVLFTTKTRTSFLYLGGGPDQRLNSLSYYEATAHIEGKVKLWEKDKVRLSLIGNAILGSVSSLVRVGIVIGI